MTRSGLSLLRTKRFGPLFLAQTLNSFNDNLYRTALLFVIAYQIVPGDEASAGTWAVIAAAIFVAPYFVFSSVAGELAERMDKARLAQYLRAIDVGIMIIAAAALLLESLGMMLAALFGTGVRAVLFGPLKYSILPQHLEPSELLAGTGMMQTISLLATIAGQIAAALLPYAISAGVLVVAAAVAFIAACFIPPAPALQPGLTIERNLPLATWKLVRVTLDDRSLLGAILGISWFYALAVMITSQFTSLVANVVDGTEDIGALLLTSFSAGIAVGAIGVNKLLSGQISARLVPLSAVALGAFTLDLWITIGGFSAGAVRIGVSDFLGQPRALRLLFDLFGIAVAAGIFVVPLFGVLQTAGTSHRRARSIAANNLLNAAIVVIIALLAGLLFALGGSIATLFLLLGITTLGIALLAWRNVEDVR